MARPPLSVDIECSGLRFSLVVDLAYAHACTKFVCFSDALMMDSLPNTLHYVFNAAAPGAAIVLANILCLRFPAARRNALCTGTLLTRSTGQCGRRGVTHQPAITANFANLDYMRRSLTKCFTSSLRASQPGSGNRDLHPVHVNRPKLDRRSQLPALLGIFLWSYRLPYDVPPILYELWVILCSFSAIL